MVMAFAVAVQAGEAQAGQDNDKPACCAHKARTSVSTSAARDADEPGCCGAKMKTANEAMGGCPFAAASCQHMAAKQTAARQPVLLSPKAASLAN